jgi:short-subunit dehydrogenase
MSAASCCGIFVIAIVAILAYPLYWVWMPPQVHDVKGKCAVVTGTSSGLGIDIAKALAAEGVAQLILTARRVEKLNNVAAEIAKAYPFVKVHPVGADVSSDEDNIRLVATAMEKFGECPVILVNNAGVETWPHFDKVPLKMLDQMIDINLKAPIHLTHAFLPSMIKTGGHIVNIGSISSKLSVYGTETYAASKFGILGFGQGLRTEMRIKKFPVSVHTVMPGFVKAAGMAEDLAKATGHKLEDCTDLYGYSYPADTGAAVIGSVKYDHPEWIVNSFPTRVLVTIGEMFPRFIDFLVVPNELNQKCTDFIFDIMDLQSSGDGDSIDSSKDSQDCDLADKPVVPCVARDSC